MTIAMKELTKACLTFFALFTYCVAMAQTEVVTFDFTSKSNWTAGTKTGYYTSTDGYTIILKSGSYSSYDGTDYIILTGKDATLTFPTFNFEVEKIEVVGNDGASKSVKQNIYVGSTAVSTEVTGSAGSNSKAKTNTFVIKESYRSGKTFVLKNTNAANSQITYIRIYPVGASSAEQIQTTTTFGTDVDGKLFTVENGGTFTGKQATVTPSDAAGTLVYTSSNERVATVAQDGSVTMGDTGGLTTITATFTPTDESKYTTSSASYTLVYNAPAATTLSFAKATDTAYLSLPYSLPALTLTAGSTTLSGQAFTYDSSNEAVATVDTDGTVALHALGSTTITASFAGNSNYQASQATLALTVENLTQKTVTFTCGIDKSSTLVLAKDGVTITLADGAFNLSGNNGAYSLLALKSMTITTDVGKIVGIVFTGTQTTENMFDMKCDVGSYVKKDFTGTWTGKQQSVTFTNKQTTRILFDKIEVTVSLVDDVTLQESESNEALLKSYANKTVNATIERTMTNDGWYTLCLPFSVPAEQMSLLNGAEVWAFDAIEDETVMRFAKAETIVAGQAYLIKPAAKIVRPTFSEVVLSCQSPTESTAQYAFVGTFSPTQLANDGTNLFLGANNELYRPSATSGALKALRAFFRVPKGTDEAKMSLAIDDETLSIADIRDDNDLQYSKPQPVYNLQGQCMGQTTEGLPRGLYIVGGKKVIVEASH